MQAGGGGQCFGGGGASGKMNPDRFASKWTLRPLLLSLLFTGLLFVLLPMTERLSRIPEAPLTLRELKRVPPPLPAPPPPEALTEPVEAFPDPLPAPVWSDDPVPAPPLPLPVDLQPVLPGTAGVVSQTFQLQTGLQGGGMRQAVFEIADLDRPPRPLFRLNPVYPPAARMRRIEGHVTVEFVVGTDGKTGELQVVDSEPGNLFVSAVVRAVKAWQFEAGQLRGEPVPARVRQRIDFSLD